MTKPDKLREGNYVLLKEEVHVILEIHDNCLLVSPLNCTGEFYTTYNSITYIFISHEIVSKLGFKAAIIAIKRSYLKETESGAYFMLKENIENNYYQVKLGVGAKGLYPKHILYVHQLQNAYHELTGEALTIIGSL
jgi:hypothetical protein